MTDGISAGRIDAVGRHVQEALTRSFPGSTFPEKEQDRLLAQACAEACEILALWRDSPEWQGQCPATRAPVADAIPDWERIRPFLGPLKETLAAVAQRQQDVPIDPASYIDGIIERAEETARRYRRFDRQQLFTEATDRVDRLRAEVCALAGDLKGDLDHAERIAKRKKAIVALGKVAGFLLTMTLAFGGASPHAVQQNIPEWGHDAVRVLVVHHAAETAEPQVRVAPPRLGPQVG
jgi:hypothetical protein